MVITNYNEMTVEELQVISEKLRIEFQINDGTIVGSERSER